MNALNTLGAIGIALSLLLSSQSVYTQDRTAVARTSSSSFAIGAQLGLATGTGVSLRGEVGRIGLEVTGLYLPWGSQWWSAGAELHYSFYRGENHRFYALLGVGGLSVSRIIGISGDVPVVVGSIGVGYELFISERTSLDFELPLVNAFLPLPQVQVMYHL